MGTLSTVGGWQWDDVQFNTSQAAAAPSPWTPVSHMGQLLAELAAGDCI